MIPAAHDVSEKPQHRYNYLVIMVLYSPFLFVLSSFVIVSCVFARQQHLHRTETALGEELFPFGGGAAPAPSGGSEDGMVVSSLLQRSSDTTGSAEEATGNDAEARLPQPTTAQFEKLWTRIRDLATWDKDRKQYICHDDVGG